jgi:exodeoxyribonuclease VII large subunit
VNLIEDRVFTVAGLLGEVRDSLESSWPQVIVEGETGRVTSPPSGHAYFSLNDDSGDATINCVMWRSRYARRTFDLKQGMRLRLTGRLTLYPPRGSFQMDVVTFSEAGVGLLALQFKEIVRKLEAEGLTAPERKRPLPLLPRRVGVVTSPTGAALRDILRVLGRRYPVPVLLSPSPVQGEDAPACLAAALTNLAAVEDVDVVIIGRGGGSAEDLAAFNDENLARLVAGHPVPVISAVGHEVDVSVTDMVADRRAATPSEAAELAVPERQEIEQQLNVTSRQLARAMAGVIAGGRNTLLRLDARIPRPDRIIMDRRQALDELWGRMTRSGPVPRIVQARHRLDLLAQRNAMTARARVSSARGSLGTAAASLSALSPLGVLGRGYAVVQRRADRSLVRSGSQLQTGEGVDVTLGEGRLACTVDEIIEGK